MNDYDTCLCGHTRAVHQPWGNEEAECVESACGCAKFRTSEVRTTDPETGAQKGMKLERHDLIPARFLTELARHYGVGAKKYEDRNWEKGYAWSKSYAALQRHLTQFWAGEDIDEETGSKHLVAAAWHCIALATFMDEHPEKDDRPTVKEWT